RQEMSFSVSASLAVTSRSCSAAMPRAARRHKAGREMPLLTGDVSIADVAAREGEKRMHALLQESFARRLRGRPAVRPEMAPQVVEKPRFAPGNGAARVALAREEPVASRAFAFAAPPIVRPESAPQAIEKPRFAPGNGAPLIARAGDEPAPSPGFTFAGAAASRSEMAPQVVEKPRFAPGNGAPGRAGGRRACPPGPLPCLHGLPLTSCPGM